MITNVIAIALAALSAGTINAKHAQPAPHEQYAVVAMAAVDREADTVTYTTHAGYMYVWDGVEDEESGELYALLMDDNGTPGTVEDDVIISARYSGWEAK